MREVYPMFLLYTFVECYAVAILAVIRGTGRQGAVAVHGFIGYFVIGVTLAFVFAVVLDWGLVGIQVGGIIGASLNTLSFLSFLRKIDLDKEIEDAKERTK